jgi:hypothetical protein
MISELRSYMNGLLDAKGTTENNKPCEPNAILISNTWTSPLARLNEISNYGNTEPPSVTRALFAVEFDRAMVCVFIVGAKDVGILEIGVSDTTAVVPVPAVMA